MTDPVKLVSEYSAAEAAIALEIARLLQPFATAGARFDLTVCLRSPTVTVKVSPPPHGQKT